MKKKKLKKKVYVFIVLIILIICGIKYGKYKYNEYLYHQTYEYKLLSVGYQSDDVDTILKTFSSDKDYAYFLDNYSNKKILELLDQKYFLLKNFYSYIEYMNKNKKMNLETVVRNINIHLDKDYYEADLSTDTQKDILLITNKYYKLDENYKPDNIVYISQDYAWGGKNSKCIREDVLNAYLDMWNAAKSEGYYLMINSAYRSYKEQVQTYDNIKNKSGIAYADSIAARPGYSEHQTGLALDIFSKEHSSKATFGDSEEAKWLENNSYKYGFILRYPKGKENITGFSYESWHFRYVGKDIATKVFESGLTYEEYYAYYIEK